MPITTEHVQAVIASFLQQRAEKADDAKKKAATKKAAVEDDDTSAVKASTSDAFTLDSWMQKAAATISQLQFGTHISKGVHPSSKGDNRYDPGTAVPEHLASSQSVPFLELDATGNSAVLPSAALFDLVVDESSNTKLHHLIQSKNPVLDGCFATDPVKSKAYQEAFYQALCPSTKTAKSDERNKQVLWPLSDAAIADDAYVCLVPLHPSSLLRHVSRTLQNTQWGPENVAAQDSWKQEATPKKPYIRIRGLAYVKIGGTKPQNAGYLNSLQSGRHRLLPNFPPKAGERNKYALSPRAESMFSHHLGWLCKAAWPLFDSVVQSHDNNVHVRNVRTKALNEILAVVMEMALYLRAQPPNWSDGYELNLAEKCWLDPHGSEALVNTTSEFNWTAQVLRTFALWLNDQLQTRYPKLADDFHDVHTTEWQRQMAQTFRQLFNT